MRTIIATSILFITLAGATYLSINPASPRPLATQPVTPDMVDPPHLSDLLNDNWDEFR